MRHFSNEKQIKVRHGASLLKIPVLQKIRLPMLVQYLWSSVHLKNLTPSPFIKPLRSYEKKRHTSAPQDEFGPSGNSNRKPLNSPNISNDHRPKKSTIKSRNRVLYSKRVAHFKYKQGVKIRQRTFSRAHSTQWVMFAGNDLIAQHGIYWSPGKIDMGSKTLS